MIVRPLAEWPRVPASIDAWTGRRVDPATILQMIRDGGTGMEVGRALGISRERVRQVWKRETGTDLPTRARIKKQHARPRICSLCGASVARGMGLVHQSVAARVHQTARFWRFVRKGPDCWEWLGKTYPTGYAQFNYGAKSSYGHRFAYELGKGPIPDGLSIDHLCRNRGCVNPAHLEAVPLGVNVLRGFGRGALNARKTHCDNGHEFSAENTSYIHRSNGSTHRKCKACQRAGGRIRIQRNRPCLRGHEPTPENVNPSGNCRPCNQIAVKAYQARKRAAA